MDSHYYTIHVAVGYDKVRNPEVAGIWPLRPKCGVKFDAWSHLWFIEGMVAEVVTGKAAHPCTECFSGEGLELYILAAV